MHQQLQSPRKYRLYYLVLCGQSLQIPNLFYPIKNFLILKKPKLKVKKSLSQEKKVIKATAKIIPGIA